MTASTRASPSSATRSERAIDSPSHVPQRSALGRATVQFVVRTWLGQALRASGVAILVPLAIVAAIALSVVGGGGSARSLGQVLTGPAVPPGRGVARRRREHREARTGSVPHSVTSTLRGQSPQRHVTPGGCPRSVSRSATVPGPAASGAPAPAAGSAARHSGAAVRPAAPAPAQPHPVHDAGTQVAQTVRPLPVAGPVAADAVQAVVDLVDPPMQPG